MNIDNIKSLDKSIDNLPEFYVNILKTWIKSRKENTKPQTFREIRQEIIWGNKYIKFYGKSLIYNNWINDNIIFINDIIDQKGCISQNHILDKLSKKSNWFSEYSKLVKAIPQEWKNILKEHQSTRTKVKVDYKITIKNNRNQKFEICSITNRQIYQILNETKFQDVTGFQKWRKVLNVENYRHHLEDVLYFTFSFLTDNRFKIMKWKLLHYILPWKIVTSQDTK